jgi:hypothetical protein
MFAQVSDGGPRPLFGVVDEARVDRVGPDVFERSAVVILVLDDVGGEAVAEQVALAFSMAVEALGVDAVEPLHPVGETLAGGFEDQVVVRSQEAEGVAAPAVAVDRARQEFHEVATIDVVEEGVLFRDGVGRDVEEPVGEVSSSNAGHRPRR